MKLNELLNKNTIVSTYVNVGSKIIDATINPLNKFMRHLLVVQGLDPNAQPGSSFRKKLSEAVDNVNDSNDFDEDFDLTWVGKSFFKVKSKLDTLNVSKSDFRRMTDLSKLTDISSESEDTLKTVRKEIDAYCESVAARTSVSKELEDTLHPRPKTIKAGSIKDALKVLEKYADKYEDMVKDVARESSTVYVSRQPNNLGNKKAKKPVKVTKSFKKGSFRRVSE